MNARLKHVLNVALFLSTIFSVLSVLIFGGYIITRLLNVAISSAGRRNLVTLGTDVAIVAQAFQFLAILLVIVTWLAIKHMPKSRHEIIVLGLSLIPFVPALIFIVVSLLYLRARLFKRSSEHLREAVKTEWGGAIDGLQNVVSAAGQNQPGNPIGAGNVAPANAAGGINPPPVPSAAHARVGPIIQSVVGPVTADSLSKAPLGLISAMITATILSLTVGGALALNAIPFPPPDVQGVYTGFITNQTFNIRTKWAITLQERNGVLSGKVTIDPPLYGSGPLTGAITRDGHVTFTAAGISYIGATQPGGALSGTYTIGNGQHGVWTVHPRGAIAAAIPTATATSAPTATATPATAQTYLVNGHPGAIVRGADGNLWFTDGNIGRITPAGTVAEFATSSAPTNLIDGPDGNVWFTETASNMIGTVTAAGVVREYTIPTAQAINPIFSALTAGPDGNVWFPEYYHDQISRVTPAGVITEFKLPTLNNTPNSIVKGPDGNLWFTERNAGGTSKIGRITPTGTITEFPTDIQDSSPADIIVGPDGNLWFTEQYGIGRMTTTGSALAYSQLAGGVASPFDLTTGPDGNVWYLDNSVNTIGSLSPTGTSRAFVAPAKFAGLGAITIGPDGNLWFTESDAGAIGKITPAGVIQQYQTLGAPGDITLGPDGNLWYTDPAGYDVGRVSP